MIPFQERKKIRKILYSKYTLGVLSVLLILVADGAWNIYQKAAIARAERDLAVRSFADLQSRNEALESSLSHLQSQTGLEEDVRQKFTVAKPGEDVVVVVDDDAKKSENSQAEAQTGFWGRVEAFFGF